MARRIATWLFLAAIVAGIAGLAITTERASAQVSIPDGDRFNLSCEQTINPNDNEGVGEVTCSLLVDLPDAFLPLDTVKLTIIATYADLDGNKRPSRGDRLLCITVIGPGGNTLLERCRPGVEPPPLSPPTSP